MNILEEMQEQFEAFHKNNPHIWEEFVKHTFQMIAKKSKYSAKAIFEVKKRGGSYSISKR